MRPYTLKVAPSKRLFDNLPIDYILIIGGSCFFALLCTGILWFGSAQSSLSFLIVLSIYAAFLGYLFARSAFKKQQEKQIDFPYLSSLSKNHEETELLVDTNSGVILYQNKGFGNRTSYQNQTIYSFIDSLDLHALDRTKISHFFQEKKNIPFNTLLNSITPNGITKILSFNTQTVNVKDKNCIILRVLDVTKEQHTTNTQQQYIRDMERIIQNRPPQSPLNLISQMAAARDLYRPLQTIQSYVQLIEKNYKNQLSEEGQFCMDAIANSSYQLHTMVEDIYTLAGLDEEHTNEVETDLNNVLNIVLENLASKIKTTEANIKLPKLPTIQADQNQLTLLFQNLIENAINYCGSQPPKIQIDWYQHSHHWIFRVSDQGMGISSKFKEQVFNYLNRGQIKTGIKGLGLGLAICKQIVSNHNGEIWVESEGAGKGCTFAFTLPMEQEVIPLYKKEQFLQPMAVSA